MNKLQVIEWQNQRVLLTSQLAKSYETTTRRISENFNANKERYIEEKHFYCLEGDALRNFRANTEITDLPSNINKLYLWTEKGTLLHAKSLNTDKAWEVYDRLVETYFRVKQNALQLPQSYPEALRELANKYEEIEALKLEDCKNKQIIGELQPKATYYDLVLQNKQLLSVTKIAKDYGMSARKLNEKLHSLGIQFKQGDCWFLYQKHASKGFTQTKTHVIDDEKGKTNMYWTQKGRLFIYETLKQEGILPLIEREKGA